MQDSSRFLMVSFDDHVAVITGAGSGIGKAIALELVRLRATVCLLGRTKEKLQQTAVEAGALCLNVKVYPMDLTSDQNIMDFRRELESVFGKVHILVHCAGVIVQGNLDCASISDFDEQYRSNVRSSYVLTQALLPMLKENRGQIVFVNSSAGLKAKEGAGQYSAMQHARKAIADSLREEVNSYGVRILSVFPGRTATPLQERLYELEEREYHPELLMQPGDVAAVVAHALALPRTAEITSISMRPLVKSY